MKMKCNSKKIKVASHKAVSEDYSRYKDVPLVWAARQGLKNCVHILLRHHNGELKEMDFEINETIVDIRLDNQPSSQDIKERRGFNENLFRRYICDVSR